MIKYFLLEVEVKKENDITRKDIYNSLVREKKDGGIDLDYYDGMITELNIPEKDTIELIHEELEILEEEIMSLQDRRLRKINEAIYLKKCEIALIGGCKT